MKIALQDLKTLAADCSWLQLFALLPLLHHGFNCLPLSANFHLFHGVATHKSSILGRAQFVTTGAVIVARHRLRYDVSY